MAGYNVLVKRSAAKEIDSLPNRAWRRRVVETIGALAEQPRSPDARKLVGSEDRYRLRLGSDRVVYLVDDARREVTIVKIGHRRDVYR